MLEILFYITATIAVLSALTVVMSKSPVNSALALILNIFCLAFIYLLLEAQFIAIIQILVYAGAIMVLFLFTIMLLNLQNDTNLTEQFDIKKGMTLLFSFIFGIELVYIIAIKSDWTYVGSGFSSVPFVEKGTVEAIGQALFTHYLFPFEMISVVLLAAVVGAIVLAKRKLS